MEVGTGTQMLTAFAATLIIFAIPSGLLATRIGRKPTIIIGLIGMIAGVCSPRTMRNPDHPARRPGGDGRILGARQHQLAADGVRSVQGRAAIGAYTGLYYFASSLAAITGPIVAGWLIDRTSVLEHLAVYRRVPRAVDRVHAARETEESIGRG